MPGLLKFLKPAHSVAPSRGYSLSCIGCGDVFSGQAESLTRLLSLLVNEGWGVLDISAVESIGGKGICPACRG